MATLAATLLASAAGLMLIEARTARAAAGETSRLMRAELELDRLLAIAVARLDAGEALAPQGILLEDESGGRVLRQDAAGLVDINAAQPATLARLFLGLGLAEERAAALADAIADWRDEDSLTNLNGGEADAYGEAGLAPPQNRPFETEGELSHVLGMTPHLLACVLPFLTTYSGQAEIDAAAAPPRLAELLTLESTARIATAAPLGHVIALTAEASLSEQAMMRRTIWVRLTGDAARPVMIHRAEQGFAPRNGAPIAACSEPPA